MMDWKKKAIEGRAFLFPFVEKWVANSRKKLVQGSPNTLTKEEETIETSTSATFSRVTPDVIEVTSDYIESCRLNRSKTAFGGCYMTQGLFVKADNSLGCSCQVGYYSHLANISEVDTGDFFLSSTIKYIRDSFKAGYEPFPFCRSCVSRSTDYPYGAEDDEMDIILHVEPSNNCNLFCEICLCTDERKSINPPPRLKLDYDAFAKMVHELHRSGIRVFRFALVGFGEPLMNPRTPDMARLVREVYPNSFVFMDTNANFPRRRAEEVANCGMNEIRIAFDGVDQVSYEGYRKKGDFQRVFDFSEELVSQIKATSSPTRAVWKYILFNHNDSDEQIFKAIEMAESIGIDIEFDFTVGPVASKRSEEELQSITRKSINCNIDRSAFEKPINPSEE